MWKSSQFCYLQADNTLQHVTDGYCQNQKFNTRDITWNKERNLPDEQKENQLRVTLISSSSNDSFSVKIEYLWAYFNAGSGSSEFSNKWKRSMPMCTQAKARLYSESAEKFENNHNQSNKRKIKNMQKI